ncbi:MAG: tail fiber assembly protein [Candidatus Phlomobacter fragariae]
MEKDNVYYFSATKLCWLAESLKESYIEDKAKPITFRVYQEYALCSPPGGKMLGASKSGDPVWLYIPPKTKNELIAEAEDEKIALMQNATDLISPLQDAIDFNMAIEEEKQKLTRWKKHRVLLNNVMMRARFCVSLLLNFS